MKRCLLDTGQWLASEFDRGQNGNSGEVMWSIDRLVYWGEIDISDTPEITSTLLYYKGVCSPVDSVYGDMTLQCTPKAIY